MGDFFHGWRRKVGLLTLLFACMFMLAWGRAQTIQDWFLFGFAIDDSNLPRTISGKSVTRGKVFYWLSSSAQYGLTCSREESKSSMSWIGGWHSCPTDLEFDPTDSSGKDSNSIMDGHWQFGGFEIGKYHGNDKSGYETFSFWRISYLSITFPLTLISLCLLLYKPHKSIQKKNL